MDITIDLVKKLIDEQCVQWSHVDIQAVAVNGWDNRMFRLGSEFVIRIPSGQKYEDKILKEWEWLPRLAQHISVHIPEPVFLGKPSDIYPLHWSVYRWIDGKSANQLSFQDEQFIIIAQELASFLKQMQAISIDGAPQAGEHNFYRGGDLSVYDEETQSFLQEVHTVLPIKKVLACWEKALSSQWKKDPVWIHGDVTSANFLILDNHVHAVIDFGGMAVGDPACDLAIAWTFFKNKSRNIFKESIDLDQDTWNRARGWTLWKALATLVWCEKNDVQGMEKQIQIIYDVIQE